MNPLIDEIKAGIGGFSEAIPLADDLDGVAKQVADLDRKLASARFNVDQLQVGRDAFFSMLKQELEVLKEEKADA